MTEIDHINHIYTNTGHKCIKSARNSETNVPAEV